MAFSFISHCGNKNQMFCARPKCTEVLYLQEQYVKDYMLMRGPTMCVCVAVAGETLASPLIMFNSTPRTYQFTSPLLPLGIRHFFSRMERKRPASIVQLMCACAVLNMLRLGCAVYPVGKQQVVAFFLCVSVNVYSIVGTRKE